MEHKEECLPYMGHQQGPHGRNPDSLCESLAIMFLVCIIGMISEECSSLCFFFPLLKHSSALFCHSASVCSEVGPLQPTLEMSLIKHLQFLSPADLCDVLVIFQNHRVTLGLMRRSYTLAVFAIGYGFGHFPLQTLKDERIKCLEVNSKQLF